jgi:hypothetical protein
VPGVPGNDRRGLVAVLYPILPASSESVYELFPCPAETTAIFPDPVIRM